MASDEQSRTGKRAVDEETRREALAKFEGQNDPLRVLIRTVLTLKPSSANDLAAELELPIGRVRYQLGRLRKAGLVELLELRPRRGVVERIYLSHPDFISNEEAAHLTAEELNRTSIEVLRAMVRDATAAIRSGTFFDRPDFTAARIPLRLDLKGWKEAAALQHQTLKRLLAIHARAARRLDDEGAEPINSMAFLLMFETAAESTPQKRSD